MNLDDSVVPDDAEEGDNDDACRGGPSRCPRSVASSCSSYTAPVPRSASPEYFTPPAIPPGEFRVPPPGDGPGSRDGDDDEESTYAASNFEGKINHITND